MRRTWLCFLPITFALITGCRSESPTEPAATEPSAPGQSGTTASLVSEGVYYVSAPIDSFDPVWGDWTGYSYATVLNLHHDAANASILSGTFADFQLRDASGQPETWRTAGTITGSVGKSGRITLELVSFDKMFSWSATGDLAGDRIVGSWGRAHFYGHFVADRNAPTP